MINIVLLNKSEFALIILAIILLVAFYKHGGYSRREILLWVLIMIPVLYFSVNMGTEIVTADEPQYEECITDIHNLKTYPAAIKVLYEYKFTQLTIGSFFWFVPKNIQDLLGANNIWKIYKSLHWMLMYGMALLTVYFWRRFILRSKNGKYIRLGENLVLIILIGLPLACLLMKVTNYDAGSTYPAILGLSIMWASYIQYDMRMAYLATLATAMGVLDKWTSLPYWVISVVLFCFLHIYRENKISLVLIKVLKNSAVACSSVFLISTLYFIYAGVQQNGFCREVDLGIIVFSFVHAVKGIAIGDLSINSSPKDVIYVFVLYLIIVVLVLFLYCLYKALGKTNIKPEKIILKIDAVIIMLGIIGGVFAAYAIPLRIAPFLQISNDKYISTDSFGQWVYHFGAKTAYGHFIAKSCYEAATIIVNYPTVIVVLLFAMAIFTLKKKSPEDSLFCSLALSSSLGLLLLYSIAGLPFDARYYSYPIFVLALSSVFLWHDQCFSMPKKVAICVIAYGLYIGEMLLFIPNVKSFSPLWLWHSEDYNENVRTGKWYAGEIMFWGEHIAIAGNLIQAIEGRDDPDKIIIYSDYTTTWPGNPGYIITSLNDKTINELRFDEDSYYIINKFWIFRNTTPKFIGEVDPFAKITYKGEVGAWIYRGDKLKSFAKEFCK